MKILYIDNKNNIPFILLIIIFKNVLNDCERDSPILKDGLCQLIYCDDSQYNTNICMKNNQIINTQWLNNIIKISNDNFRYIDITSNTKGDMFIETSPISDGSERRFYAIKNNGRPYFINSENKEETPFFIMNEVSTDLKRHESNLISIVINNENNDEYLMSISAEGSVEIYDFVEKERKYVASSTFMGLTFTSLYNIPILVNSDNYYYILIPITCNTNDYYFGEGDYFYVKRYLLSSIEISDSNTYTSEATSIISTADNKILSCILTQSNILICILATYLYPDLTNMYYCYSIYGNDLIYLNVQNFYKLENSNYSSNFVKGIHLKEEIIAVYFYKTLEIGYGYLLIQELKDDYFLYAVNSYEINIDKVSFYTNIEYNDFIKINENKLCIASISSTQKVYLITITLFNDYKDIIIYYYSIELYKLYNFNINGDIKLHSYNNFITFCASVCNEESCDSHTIFSTLIIFSYPNCIDRKIDLIEYLSNNNTYINDFEINLANNFKIENNIFGYIFDKIKITNIFEKDYLKVIKTNGDTILSNNNNELASNEIIKLYNDGTDILKGEYKIEYVGIVTEPDFIQYIQYPEINDTTFQLNSEYSNKFTKSSYTGKTTYYIIDIVNDLTSDCLNECQLCFKDSQNCIYEIEEINSDNSSENIINDNETNIVTSIITDINTYNDYIDSDADSATEINTDLFTDNHIDSDVNSATQINTDIFTDNNIDSDVDINEDTDIYTDIDKSEKIFEKETTKIEQNCTIDNILNNVCNEKIINNDEIKDIYNKMEQDILNKNYSKNPIITGNAAFHITEYDNQTNNYNISSVDLGICEEIIKNIYEIPEEESLIIFKSDIKNEDLTATYVQYEIFDPCTLQKIDLDICKDIPVTINSTNNLDEKAIILYDSLQEYGYNLFNSDDIFYNDICSRYTSENGTDMTLNDRKKLLVEYSNIPLCQANCSFMFYNSSNNMTTCSCPIQTKNTSLEQSNIIFNKALLFNTFYLSISNSNFRVMKCYKLFFSLEGQIYNFGSYILIFNILIFIILMVFCFVSEIKKINYFIDIVIKAKFINNNIKNNIRDKEIENIIREKNKKLLTLSGKKTIKKNEKKPSSKNLAKKKERFHTSVSKLNDKHDKHDKKVNKLKHNKHNTKNNKKRNGNQPPKKLFKLSSKKIKINKNEQMSLSSTKQKFKINNTNIFSLYLDKKNKSKNNTKNNIFKTNSVKINANQLRTKKIIINDEKILNEYELNHLNYEKALIYDKRRFFQIYWSIVKHNNLILFAIMPINDFNLRTIKISLLIMSFSLYFTINCFFFSDDTMHKIYIDLGKYNFLNQFLQMIYSTIVSSTINLILKLISLSGKNILLIKRQPNVKCAIKSSKDIETCEKVKIIIFYILSLCFLIFFWYFIGCFCAVYINTQKILFYDSLITFGSSMIYPFLYSLLATIFRLMALRRKNKKYEWVYKIGLIIS